MELKSLCTKMSSSGSLVVKRESTVKDRGAVTFAFR